jgi:hypothetical protein
MAVTIDGPVGLRWRTQNVKNNARDQAKIIALLAGIPQSQGGKKESWTTPPLSGPDGSCPQLLADAIWGFQEFWKAKGVFRNIDGVVDPGMNTLAQMNAVAGGSPAPGPVAATFVCGPDVTEQIATIWSKVQTDFNTWSFFQKVQACNKIFLPFKWAGTEGIPTDLSIEELKQKARAFADINAFDTLPLFQGNSAWLRKAPVFDPKTNGPCATPSSKKPDADTFDDAHEDEETCSNSVQVAGQCWLNGTVNYGTLGVMVKLCNGFAATHPAFTLTREKILKVYSLEWATMLIRAYKTFGAHPEAAALPIAWTEATYRGGVRGVPKVAGNRPKCKCTCQCRADVVKWDYVWEPVKPRTGATAP